MQRSAIIAVTSMSALMIFAIVILEIFHAGDNSVAIGHVLTIGIPTTMGLLGLLRSNDNGEKLKDIHTQLNGHSDKETK